MNFKPSIRLCPVEQQRLKDSLRLDRSTAGSREALLEWSRGRRRTAKRVGQLEKQQDVNVSAAEAPLEN